MQQYEDMHTRRKMVEFFDAPNEEAMAKKRDEAIAAGADPATFVQRPVSAEEQCPCGSGRRFRFCCANKVGKGPMAVAPIAAVPRRGRRPAPIKEMTDAQVFAYVSDLANLIDDALPAGPSARGGALFFLMFNVGDGDYQYLSNGDAVSLPDTLRKMADRLEAEIKSREQHPT
jgi:hypothetical protein